MSANAPNEEIPISNPPWSREAWGLFAGIWLASLLFLAGVTLADPDLWGHTLYGMRAIERGVLTERSDPFSYTAPGAKWVNHEWLTEWQLGWLWRNAQQTGLVLWRNAWLLVLWLVAGFSLTRPQCRLAASGFLLVLTAECLSDFVVFIRPQMATFGLFAVMLFLLRRFWDKPQTRVLYLLPVLMALWVNWHGGFLAGVGIQAAFVFAGFWDRKTPQNQRRFQILLGVFLASLAGTFFNPYGWEMHAMLWEHLGTKQLVREWQPLWDTRQSPIYYVPFFLIGLSLFGARKTQFVDWIILALVSWQAVSHLRHVALLAITVFILLPEALTAAWLRLFPRLTEDWSRPVKRIPRILVTGLVIGFFGFLHFRATKELRPLGIGYGEIAVETQSHVPGMPLNALAVIKDQGLTGNVITDYGWGQCVIWFGEPDLRVAFDGRYRTVYPPDLEEKFLRWHQVSEADASTPLLDDYPTEIALLPSETATDRYLQSRADWAEIYRDDQAVLFVSRGIARFQETIHRAKVGQIPSPNLPRWVHFSGSLPTGTSVARDVSTISR